jgi:NAD(P)-dependent dehydrogenase (short-subunit alcohol dehydrogenase family)
MGNVSGKVALVTGGGRGIGAATALELAHRGADVAVVARSSGEVNAVAKVKPRWIPQTQCAKLSRARTRRTM